MQLNIAERHINKVLMVVNTAALLVICVRLNYSRPLQIDSSVIQDRITNLNIYSET